MRETGNTGTSLGPGATCNQGTGCFSSQHSPASQGTGEIRPRSREIRDPAPSRTGGIASAVASETGFHCFVSYPDAQGFLAYPPGPPFLPPPIPTRSHRAHLAGSNCTPIHFFGNPTLHTLGLHPCLVLRLPRWS